MSEDEATVAPAGLFRSLWSKLRPSTQYSQLLTSEDQPASNQGAD